MRLYWLIDSRKSQRASTIEGLLLASRETRHGQVLEAWENKSAGNRDKLIPMSSTGVLVKVTLSCRMQLKLRLCHLHRGIRGNNSGGVVAGGTGKAENEALARIAKILKQTGSGTGSSSGNAATEKHSGASKGCGGGSRGKGRGRGRKGVGCGQESPPRNDPPGDFPLDTLLPDEHLRLQYLSGYV